MKRTVLHIIAAVSAAISLCGCGKNVPDHIYSPGERMSVETRSTLKEALASGDAFGVIGYCMPYQIGTTNPDPSGAVSTWSAKRNLCPPNVFFGQKVTVTDNGCIYDFEGQEGVNNPKYWYRWNAGQGYGLDGNQNDIVGGCG